MTANIQRNGNLPKSAKLPAFLFYQVDLNWKSMQPTIKLSQQALAEFKTIYQKEFGVILDDEEASEIAIRLLRFFDILSRPTNNER